MGNNSNEKELSQTIVQVISERKPQTVKQLASLVKESTHIPEQEIVDFILKLQSEGKIRLSKQLSPSMPKLATYLKAEQAYWYWVTITLAIATTAVVLAIPENFYPWVYIRYSLGAILTLFLPGYTLIRALYPEKEIPSIERIALSLGMTLALLPIVGLLLNFTPFGIRLAPVTLSLTTLTIAFSTIAIIREHKVSLKQNVPHKILSVSVLENT